VVNIADEYPEKHQELFNEMMAYFETYRARFPKPNPDYDPEEYMKDRKTETRIKWNAFEGRRELDEDEK
jgi:hypothetical protein